MALEYKQRERLERVRELLAGTQDTVLDIALQVGWESASCLGRKVKGTWGMTAEEVRAQARGKAS